MSVTVVSPMRAARSTPEDRRTRMWLRAAIVVVLACGSRGVLAQQPSTRTEEIDQARRQKQAMLWPEREDPLVERANGRLDRGFGEGLRNGTGANGWQVLFAGTRPNQGQAFGIGYRRSDLLHDALTARAAIRGTLAGAFVVDGGAELNRLRHSADTFVTLSA